jgi:hypothetical protein
MDMRELEAESAELLPGREALGRLKMHHHNHPKITHNNVANVWAENSSQAFNVDSDHGTAWSQAVQEIVIEQQQ